MRSTKADCNSVETGKEGKEKGLERGWGGNRFRWERNILISPESYPFLLTENSGAAFPFESNDFLMII